jgi:single-strand DNA-binding protein
MGGSVNKIILIGNLGSDPEVRFADSGTEVATFSVATNEAWQDKSGQKQERTEWHRVVTFGPLAKLCGEYLSKGRQVYLEGQVRYNKWEDDQGTSRTSTDVVAREVTFLGGSGEPVKQGQPKPGGIPF